MSTILNHTQTLSKVCNQTNRSSVIQKLKNASLTIMLLMMSSVSSARSVESIQAQQNQMNLPQVSLKLLNYVQKCEGVIENLLDIANQGSLVHNRSLAAIKSKIGDNGKMPLKKTITDYLGALSDNLIKLGALNQEDLNTISDKKPLVVLEALIKIEEIIKTIQKEKDDIACIFDAVSLHKRNDLLMYLLDAAYGRGDCEEQAILTLSILEKTQGKPYQELDKSLQDLILVMHILTPEIRYDSLGMEYDEHRKNRFVNINSDLGKCIVINLKTELSNAMLGFISGLAKKYQMNNNTTDLMEVNPGLFRIKDNPMGIVLKHIKEAKIPLVVHHLQLLKQNAVIQLVKTEIQMYINDERYNNPDHDLKNQPALGIDMYSLQEDEKELTDLPQNIQKHIQQRSREYQMNKGPLIRYYDKTAELTGFEPTHCYPCSGLGQEERVRGNVSINVNQSVSNDATRKTRSAVLSNLKLSLKKSSNLSQEDQERIAKQRQDKKEQKKNKKNK